MGDDSSLVASFDAMSLFQPPIVRSAGALLDRALFSKTIPTAAARVTNLKDIHRYRTQFEKSKDILKLERLVNVRADPDQAVAAQGVKCILLKPQIKPGDPTTWSPILQEAVEGQEIKVVPYDLTLDYDYWTYYDVMSSLLPETAQDEIPQGFSIVGHVAHLNLKDEYLPYKYIIAEVLMDKNAAIRTVINKIDNVGTQSEYRTFKYEVLAGPDDMHVEIHEGNCIFRFDYSKVYWNSKLQIEHRRLVDLFNPGEVVCDVMAGVGPFALPAAKKGVFVWANDLNPASYRSLKEGIEKNKVGKFVYAFNEDGHTFIKHAARNVLETTFFNQNKISIPGKLLRKTASSSSSWSVQPRVLTIPPTINHFVMNLPATAIEFLGSFKGLYYGYEDLFEPHTKTKLPMVHVHCFLKQGEVPVNEEEQICERISASLGYVVKPGDKELVIHEVRDVAPKKKMFCASFRLPAEVAFWGPSAQEQSGLQEKSGQSNNETGTAENLVKWSAFKP